MLTGKTFSKLLREFKITVKQILVRTAVAKKSASRDASRGDTYYYPQQENIGC